jgi:RNA 2',3'-cyclic 3'-phosphodiesterase
LSRGMRLFTGISIAPHIVDNLERVLRELRLTAHLNWSPADNLHITTKFIGEWPEERLAEMRQALETLDPPEHFDISISGFGFFPDLRHPRVFFTSVQTGPHLGDLAGQIDHTLAKIGCAREARPFTPHLTLARIKGEDIRELREHVASLAKHEFGAFKATDFHLYHSKPGRSGSVYTKLASFPLGKEMRRTV